MVKRRKKKCGEIAAIFCLWLLLKHETFDSFIKGKILSILNKTKFFKGRYKNLFFFL